MIEIDKRRSINSVQYLRALAALIVLISHSFEHPLHPHTTREIFVSGRIGVVLFFVISGFIMVTVTGTRSFSAKGFIAKRIVRVVPFYWFITIVTAIGAVLVPAAFKATTVDATILIASLLFVPAVNPASGAVLPLIKLGWTLNYEMFFYIVFSCLAAVRLWPRIIIATLFFIALIVIGELVQTNSAALNFYTNSIQLGFVGGMLIGALCREYEIESVPAVVTGAIGLITLALFYVCYTLKTDLIYSFSLPNTLIMVTSCLSLLFVGLWVERKGYLAHWKWLHFIGDASYSIYLVHMFGVGLVVAVAAKMAVPLHGIGYAGVVLSSLLAGLIIGCLTYVFLEKPLITFSRNLVWGRVDKVAVANQPG